MTNVIVVIGAGSIGQAIARRVSAGKHVLLADLRKDNIDAAAFLPACGCACPFAEVRKISGAQPVLAEPHGSFRAIS